MPAADVGQQHVRRAVERLRRHAHRGPCGCGPAAGFALPLSCWDWDERHVGRRVDAFITAAFRYGP